VTHTTVLGSGIVGTAAAWDLVRRGHQVVVADAVSASAAADATGATPVSLDAEDESAVLRLLDDTELVVSGLPYRFGVPVATAAIATQTHYLDFGGNPTIVAAQLDLDEAAATAGVAVVPDCGLAPGMANVLAAGVVADLGGTHIDELRIRVGALPAEPVGTLGYQLAFNPAGLINEYAEPCEVLRGGAYATVEPLTGREEIEWEPFGTLEAFHTAGGSSTLPHRLSGVVDDLDYKTLRYRGHMRAFRAMLEIGLFDEDPQPGTGVAPRRVLLEALDRWLPRGGPDVVLVRVWGRAGDRVTGFQIVDRDDGRFSALARTTAFPTTAVAAHILDGQVEPGARAMDAAIDADSLLAAFADNGIVADAYAPASRAGA
jgi:lysine 6-dehydrogenase